MRATDFEVRHQTLLHQGLVLAAFLTYLTDRDDIVWHFIKDSGGNIRGLEREIFAAATLLFGIAAYLCTVRRLRGRQRYLGEFLYAFALGTLAPLSGCLILVVGDGIRLLRLAGRDHVSGLENPVAWAEAFRSELVKWGLFLTMVVFTITLIDRVAEILAGASVLIWTMLNVRRSGGVKT